MAILDEKECERDDIKKIIKASECMKHYKTIETVKKDNVVKTYEFAESVHTIRNVEFVKTEEKTESFDSCDQPTGNVKSVETFVKRLGKEVFDNNNPKVVEALQMSKNVIENPDLNPDSPKFIPTTSFNDEIQIQEELACIDQKRAEVKESFETLKNNIQVLKGAFELAAKSLLDQKFIEDSLICHNYLESLQSTGHTLPDEVTKAIKRAKRDKHFEFFKKEKKSESVESFDKPTGNIESVETFFRRNKILPLELEPRLPNVTCRLKSTLV